MKTKPYFGLFAWLIVITAQTYALEAVITVIPDTSIYVGENLFLSGATSIPDSGIKIDTFSWDFGDGYALKKGFPKTSSTFTGISCIHPFMKPGTFPVQLFIADKAKKYDTAIINIHVSGSAPIAGFEVWHAPIHARIAQKFDVQIPVNVAASSSNGLRITLKRVGGDDKILLDKKGLKRQESLLFKNSELGAGKYTLVFTLTDGAGTALSEIIAKFEKDHDGLPTVGINENNAICVKGKPFFPVTPYLLDKGQQFKTWHDGNYINCLYGEGYYDQHNAGTWSDYLNESWANGWYAIGPDRWDWTYKIPDTRNSNPQKIAAYVEAAKNKSALLMWGLFDEPNMGSSYEYLPVEVFGSWAYICHKLDHQHPTCVNLYGFDYLPYYQNNGSLYDFNNNAQYFGGKKTMPVDVIGFDIYPLQAAGHASLKNRHVISESMAAFDKMLESNKFLVPAMAFVEIQRLSTSSPPAPTMQQILMEAWLYTIHGAKGINWFPFFDATPAASFTAMATFNNQIAIYSSILLSAAPDYTPACGAKTTGKRVDLMYRKYSKGSDTSHYFFTARLTEPDSSQYYIQSNEPDSITVSFNVSGIAQSGTIAVEGENRTIQLTNGTFSDKFAKCAVKIYRLGKDLTAHTRQNQKEMEKKRVVPGRSQAKPVEMFDLKGRAVGNWSKDERHDLKFSKGIYLVRNGNRCRKFMLSEHRLAVNAVLRGR